MATMLETQDADSQDRNGKAESLSSLLGKSKRLADNSITISTLFSAWQDWQKYLAKRKPRDLFALIDAGKHSPWFWGLTPDRFDESTVALINQVDKDVKSGRFRNTTLQLITDWVERYDVGDDSLAATLETLAVVHAMPLIMTVVDAEHCQRLVDIVEDQLRIGTHTKRETGLLERQLRVVELPHLWAFVTPELKGHRSRLKTARREWTLELDESLDGEGSVQASDLAQMRALLATWTRTAKLADALEQKPLGKQTRLRFEWFIREVVRWTRPDRTQFLDFDEKAGEFGNRFCKAAVSLSHDREDDQIADFALAGKTTSLSKKAARKRVVVVSDLPSPASHSEWAETAVLRSNWHPAGQSLFVDYSDSKNLIELFHTLPILAGEMNSSLQVDGREIDCAKEWSEVCWHQDDDVCYLEIEQEINDRISLQRQFLLAVQDKFLYFSDALLTKDGTTIDYQVEFPLAEGVRLETAKETREGILHYGKHTGLVLPLASPEWRSEKSSCDLGADPDRIVLSGARQGKRHYYPMFIDLDPRRSKRQFTWRRLTVAKERQIESADQAFGARVQVGKEQWLFFRALAPVAPRTVFGEHLNCEFHVSQFFGGGESIQLISVEQEDE